jgi:hypothetical protein
MMMAWLLVVSVTVPEQLLTNSHWVVSAARRLGKRTIIAAHTYDPL